MMKKSLFSGAAGLMTLFLVAGCQVTTPAPIADNNSAPLPEPISYYGGIELFDEKTVPLAVMVKSAAAAEETAFAETLKNILNKSNVISVPDGKPCDIQIIVNSDYQVLTPAPQCRLKHTLAITVAAADGTKLLPVWSHKSELQQAYPSFADAKNKLDPQIKESIKAWEKNNFVSDAEKAFKVSVVRFRMSRRFIELNPIQFEKDLRIVLNKLRRIDGVDDVRMIEANKETRIVSFRILSRKNMSLKNEIRKQR